MKLSEGFRLVERAGIKPIPWSLRRMKPPCVVKLDVETTTHKTEIGGVKVALTEKQLEKAVKELSKKGELLFQKYLPGIETIASAKKDPTFGTVVFFGSGGIAVEELKDLSGRIWPFGLKEAQRMVEETRLYRVLSKRRIGVPKGLPALLRNLGKLAERKGFKVVEINPLMIYKGKALAADVRIEE